MIKQFESSMEALEALVENLEKGDLSLDESLTQFEKGIALIKKCSTTLQKAEQKIQKLTEDDELEPFLLDDDE